MAKAKPKNKGGRPPSPGEKRTRLVQFYLTVADSVILEKAATAGRFRGVSTLLTALVEPILQGGLSVASAARSVVRVQRRMVEAGARFGAAPRAFVDAVKDFFAPPPPIPEEPEDLIQLREDLRVVLAELETEIARQTITQKQYVSHDRKIAAVRTDGVGRKKAHEVVG